MIALRRRNEIFTFKIILSINKLTILIMIKIYFEKTILYFW